MTTANGAGADVDPLDQLVAIEGIRRAKARYFRGIDTKNEALVASVLAEDVTADYRGAATDPVTGINAVPGTSTDVLVGRDVVAKALMAAVAGMVTVHHGCDHEIEVTGPDTAEAIWAMVDRLRFPSGASVQELVGWGHYHETYARESGDWKIQRLRLTRLRLDVTLPA